MKIRMAIATAVESANRATASRSMRMNGALAIAPRMAVIANRRTMRDREKLLILRLGTAIQLSWNGGD